MTGFSIGYSRIQAKQEDISTFLAWDNGRSTDLISNCTTNAFSRLVRFVMLLTPEENNVPTFYLNLVIYYQLDTQ